MLPKKINRRSFLQKCAGTAVATITLPYAVPSSVLGKAGAVAPSNRITTGHIGVGGMGGPNWGHIKTLLPNSQAQIVAVCDVHIGRREKAKSTVDQAYGNRDCRAYKDFRELLAREDIDAVIIATPDHWHVPIASAAARAGKDMYVEKPLGLSVEWNKALRAVVNRHGCIFQYGTQQRSGQRFRFACELVRNGRIGKLKTIDVWCAGKIGKHIGSTTPIEVPEELDYDFWLGPAQWTPYTSDRCTHEGTWYVYDNSLGFVAGWGAHVLDIAQWGNGTELTGPIEYEGTGIIPGKGLFDTMISWDIYCRYANGVEMHFMSRDVARSIITRYRADNDHGTTFIGTEGWVSVDRRGIYAKPPELLQSSIGPDEIHLYASSDHKQNFLDCIKTRSKTISPIEPAVRSDTISHLCDIVIRTGQKIKWDPEKEAIIGDDTASRMLNRAMRSPWHL